MSSLFISHSGRDSGEAAEIGEWLKKRGYRAVFLDLDKKTGIPVGSDWEQRIYRALESCRAVVLLCSKHSMASRWCFAEIAHTRALGKAIFPLMVGDCEVWPELRDTQALDLRPDREAALEGLAAELERVVRDRWRLPWEPNGPRAPYPGLLPFDRQDAAIFFGRDEEIHRGLELLNRLRRFPGTRLAMVVGASSSGKSSLMRAGLLPRLEQDPQNWLVLRPFRPLRQPFIECALILAEAFERVGAPRDREEIQRILTRAAEQEPADGAALVGLARELVTAGQARDGDGRLARAAGVLLPIDQLEELLGSVRSEEAEPFLRLLRGALEVEDSSLVVIATLRSDYLGSFQQDTTIGGVKFRGLPLSAMTPEGLRRVIEGPAEIDELTLGEGLVDAILEDVETAEALPLLAFALGELYELARASREERVIELADYRDQLGGLATAVGRAADGVLAADPLSSEEEEELRWVFVGKLVAIDSQGEFVRRPAQWKDLPARVHPIMERFVKARLLTGSGDGETATVELRHEALFRTWKKMIRWLDEDREALLWRKRVESALEQWQSSGRSQAQLLQGAALAEAASWHERRPQKDLQEFILTSARVAASKRHRKLGLAAALIAVLAILVSMIMSANLQTAKIRNAWARADGARRSAELAEDEAIALAQRARLKEQQAKRLVEVFCPDRAIDDCIAERESSK